MQPVGVAGIPPKAEIRQRDCRNPAQGGDTATPGGSRLLDGLETYIDAKAQAAPPRARGRRRR